jgi:cytochrome c nitrite reductase small subunit
MPSNSWLRPVPALLAAAALGAAAGVGGFAFAYAKGSSYLGNDPTTCANCHVMTGHLDAWQRSPHHAAASCNDCHVPSANVLVKYAAKAGSGWHHSMAFTVGGFPDVIRARPETRAVIDGQCRSCHADVVDAMTAGGEVSCVRCHDSVGHLR